MFESEKRHVPLQTFSTPSLLRCLSQPIPRTLRFLPQRLKSQTRSFTSQSVGKKIRQIVDVQNVFQIAQFRQQSNLVSRSVTRRRTQRRRTHPHAAFVSMPKNLRDSHPSKFPKEPPLIAPQFSRHRRCPRCRTTRRERPLYNVLGPNRPTNTQVSVSRAGYHHPIIRSNIQRSIAGASKPSHAVKVVPIKITRELIHHVWDVLRPET